MKTKFKTWMLDKGFQVGIRESDVFPIFVQIPKSIYVEEENGLVYEGNGLAKIISVNEANELIKALQDAITFVEGSKKNGNQR